MPNIPEFNAPPTAVEPSDKGIQASEVAGRRLGMYGHQLEADANQIGTAVEQHQADMELSHGYAASTSAEANLTNGWNQFVADPANKGLVASGAAAKTYMDQVVEPTLQKFSDSGFQTQKGKAFAIAETARLRQNLFTRTLGEQSALTGQIWQSNAQQTQNNMAASVLQDPSDANVNEQMALNSKFVEDTIPASVIGAERARLREEFETTGTARIALSVYLGQMETIKQQYAQNGSSPAEAQVRDRLAKQEWFQYLSPEQQAALPVKLDEAVSRGQQLYKAGVNTQDQQLEDQGRGELTQLANQLHDTLRAGQTPTPAQLQQVDALAGKYAGVKGLTGDISNIQTLADQGITDAAALKFQRSDPRTLDAFSNRALLPTTDPRALTQTEVDAAFNGTGGPGSGTLSAADHERLTKQITERDKPDSRTNVALKQIDQFAQTAIRGQLTHSPGLLPDGSPNTLAPPTYDPQGDAAWAEARREIHIRFAARVNAGEDPNAVAKDLMNLNSPHSLMASVKFWKQAAQSPDAGAFFRTPYGRLGMGQVVNQADQVPTPVLTPEPIVQPPASSSAVTIPIGPQVKAAQAAALASPRKPGETAAAYLKRIGD